MHNIQAQYNTMVLNHTYRGGPEIKYRQFADESLKEIIISTYRR